MVIIIMVSSLQEFIWLDQCRPEVPGLSANRYSFIHSFVSDNKVHRLSLHKRTDRDGYNLTTTQPADHCLNGRTHLTTALKQTATLLAKLTLQLRIRMLKLGSPSSNNILVTLLYFGYPNTLNTF